MNTELRDPTVDEAAVFMRVWKSWLYDAKGGERSFGTIRERKSKRAVVYHIDYCASDGERMRHTITRAYLMGFYRFTPRMTISGQAKWTSPVTDSI